jgi:hypothetical protein
VEDRDAANVGQLRTKLPQITGAKVGQFPVIAEVDERGMVVAFEAVDAPSGDGGLNIVDDGAGNVTITLSGSASIVDDGNGNVTIA